MLQPKKLCNLVSKETKYKNSIALTQSKCKLSLVNKYSAKIAYNWHTIDCLILHSAFLSLMLVNFCFIFSTTFF